MKTDLKPILAAAMKNGAEFRIKSKFSPGTLIISTETIGEFDEISFDPDWVETAKQSGTVVYFSPSDQGATIPAHRDDTMPQLGRGTN